MNLSRQNCAEHAALSCCGPPTQRSLFGCMAKRPTRSREVVTFRAKMIDNVEPPKLFMQVQTPSIASWIRQQDTRPIVMLKGAIASLIDRRRGYEILESVKPEEPVEARHLNLIHSCWRVNKMTKFGLMPYQIHLIIYGHETALERIESVDYYLPGYPDGYQHRRGAAEDRLFELKELANGFSIAQATVNFRPRAFKGKPAARQAPMTLSRFINLSESGPRLDDFILTRPLE